jgi:anti-sigma factor RsiW
MNCLQFKDQLFEYVEGSLAPPDRTKADSHLKGCAACRLAVSQERQTALLLSAHFQAKARHLALPPVVKKRMGAPRALEIPVWNRFAWPLAMAASFAVVLTIFMAAHRSAAPYPIAVDMACRVPIHTFHKDGTNIVDALSYQTVEVSETLWSESQNPKGAPTL